jgi:hypothetical protein
MHDTEPSPRGGGKRPPYLPLAVIMLLAGVLAALVWQRVRLPAEARVAVAADDCDLHAGPCRAWLPEGGWVELEIAPRPIEMLEPLELQVRTGALGATAARVDFAGEDMYMGFNRPELGADDEGFAGTGILPMCVTDSMTWRTTVLLETPAGPVAAPFRFTTWRTLP